MEKITVHSLESSCGGEVEMALRYYGVLSLVAGLSLTPRELQLLAFTATRGSISSGSARGQFVQRFGSSRATVANMVHKLIAGHYLIRKDKRIVVHPKLALNFSQPILLALTLNIPNENQYQGPAHHPDSPAVAVAGGMGGQGS